MFNVKYCKAAECATIGDTLFPSSACGQVSRVTSEREHFVVKLNFQHQHYFSTSAAPFNGPHLLWFLLFLDCFKRVSSALDQLCAKTFLLAPKIDCQGPTAAKVDVKLYSDLCFIA